jgi:hypothetical protein
MVTHVTQMLTGLSGHCLLFSLLSCYPVPHLMAEQNPLIIDDRTSGDMISTSGKQWRLVTDGVMGGVSDGRLEPAVVRGRACLRLQGEVRLDNNGGFIQAALDVPDELLDVVKEYRGVLLEVSGNNEPYNLHLRTRDLWMPWQSYRTTFAATPEWQTLNLPFADFKPYRTTSTLNTSRLKRIGILAIGRAFDADLCIGRIGLYR